MAKLKFIGKKPIRTQIGDSELNLNAGEIYDDANLTNAYLSGLIAQGFFEIIPEAAPDKKDKEKDNTPKTEK